MTTPAGGILASSPLTDLLKSSSAEPIQEYLTLMEDSEPPRAYHVWSLLAGVAALLGKNSRFTSGPYHTVTPNLFVVLLGPAGVRKSSAIRAMEKLLKETTVRFGPTDTGGQRHGLMTALTGLNRGDVKWLRRSIADQGPITQAMLQPRKSSDLMLIAPELGRLLGQGTRDMADFMIDLYDNAKIDYETKNGATNIDNPLVTLLAATTPSSLADMIPANAGTHGILSRILFVYEDKRYKDVPLPREPDSVWHALREKIMERLHWIDGNRMNFFLEKSAEREYELLYTYVPMLEDARLEQYRERRANILQRIAMCLCALRFSTMINVEDLDLAHELMKTIEPKMHKALEYFGRNKIFAGRMLMIQYLRAVPSHYCTRPELLAAAASELNQREAEEAIENMIASKELIGFGENFLALGEIKNELLEAKRKKEGAQVRTLKPRG